MLKSAAIFAAAIFTFGMAMHVLFGSGLHLNTLVIDVFFALIAAAGLSVGLKLGQGVLSAGRLIFNAFLVFVLARLAFGYFGGEPMSYLLSIVIHFGMPLLVGWKLPKSDASDEKDSEEGNEPTT